MFLQSDHAQAEAPRSTKASSACALHAGRDRRRREHLPGMAQEEPRNPIALHMLAACTGRDVPRRASNGFVERTFDSFASSFEAKLQRLSYRAPALVAAMLEDSRLEPLKCLDVLDAGCGTGLCGPLLASYARKLTGVDLSKGCWFTRRRSTSTTH